MDLNSLFSSIDLSTVNIVGGAALVVGSFLANGQLNRMAARREAKIRFVESQLEDLYGPLYAITQSNGAIYEKFRQSDPELVGAILEGGEIDAEGGAKRELWNASVFQPSNLRMRDVIENNAHLFAAETMPASVLQFLAHVENWEAVLSAKGGGSAPKELVAYPETFPEYIAQEYDRISKRHAKLVGRSRK